MEEEKLLIAVESSVKEKGEQKELWREEASSQLALSVYLRRCDSDRCATERAFRRSQTADSASWDHQALGGTTKAAKEIEALAASTKNREEEWAAWWMLSASKSREGRCSAI